MVHQGVEAKLEAHSVHLEIVLTLMQERCTVYTDRTTGLELILDAPDGTARLLGSCGV
jgi:hypothetical protein